MHFTWEISIGNLLTLLFIVIGGFKFYGLLTKLVFEHELMWIDYCNRKGITTKILRANHETIGVTD